ncbi:unnamed protein product [Cyprideis torosa]|uniref:Uncharacterized protein n=1 Tax=Cyprideis torosa TaxID=163714 RepID=A0A7R8ZVA1_9CRUS|nr:unnamed protein product [Cyprideis torosa]CAG0902232.1 unnamed protein product [Cyprideis torosa]
MLSHVMDKFNMDMSTLLELFRDQQRYEWLPTKEEIPKSIGDPTPESALQALETSSFLPTLYEFFQKYSVGLEQVLLDEAIYEGEYLEDLKVTEDRVGALLCELQVSMMEKGITPNPDVSREIMSEEFRDIESDAMRNLRDWIILRDLMNALEFSLDALAYLEEHVPENEKNRTQNGI